jgi:hypothetical protein
VPGGCDAVASGHGAIIGDALRGALSVAVCKKCGIGEEETYLLKCPICHEMVCEEDKYVRSGREFCSEDCAAGFFHGDDDDEDETEG